MQLGLTRWSSLWIFIAVPSFFVTYTAAVSAFETAPSTRTPLETSISTRLTSGKGGHVIDMIKLISHFRPLFLLSEATLDELVSKFLIINNMSVQRDDQVLKCLGRPLKTPIASFLSSTITPSPSNMDTNCFNRWGYCRTLSIGAIESVWTLQWVANSFNNEWRLKSFWIVCHNV